ncbi:MAG: biotin--[acetyl-CoA-carboxylase] ligase, partial [Phycisphaerales bacterium]
IACQYAAGGEKNHGLVVLTEHQTKGRGRRGNKWFDGKSKSTLCSLLIFNDRINPDMMALAIAVAAAQAIGKCGKSEPQIKWPNDIFINDKKIAGILIEKKLNYYIIGIGINCHQQETDFPQELLPIATSIDIETTAICDRNLIVKRLIVEIEHALQIAIENPDEIVESWQQRSMLTGKRITIEHNGNQFTGICLGVEPSQGLILHLERGGVKMFDAASTTIVK